MPLSAQIFLAVIFMIFLVLDIILMVSLLRPGDERGQIIVWKSAAITLLGITGSWVLDVAYSFFTAQALESNPLVDLQTTAIIYCAALLFYRKRHGG